jgi:hypothetical protein
LPEDERLAVERHLREFDRLGEDLKVIERDLARSALADEAVKRLMTIPGVDMIVALAIRGGDRRRGTLRAVAEAGELPRPQPERTAVRSWTGVSRPDHQAGPRACARHACRGGLGVCASAGSIARVLPTSPRPPRSACRRCRDRPQARGYYLAFAAQRRKLCVARPALHAKKLRDLELKAGYKAERGQRGAAYVYNIKSHRDQERR